MSYPGTHRYSAHGAWMPAPVRYGSLASSHEALAVDAVIAALDRAFARPAKINPNLRRRRVMLKAWELKRGNPTSSFGYCLKFAWKWAG